jgi:hypothetical protein
MRIAILSANLDNFDVTAKEPSTQLTEHEVVFHRFTDEDFPPIADFPPRLQYRIPKCFGWEMFPGYDVYIWLDSSMSLQRPDCVEWFLTQLGDADMAFFKHPWRGTMQQEVKHIETKLKEDNKYITPRYKNGLHREQLKLALDDPNFIDDQLYASNVFIYRNNQFSRETLQEWWFQQSRYYTCDQVNLPFALHLTPLTKINKINENVFKVGYVSLVSHHK